MGTVAGRSTGSLGSMESTSRNTGKAVAVSRWYLRGLGLVLLVTGGLWLVFGQFLELLGGASLAIAGVAAIVISMAKDGNVSADTARTIVEMYADGE